LDGRPGGKALDGGLPRVGFEGAKRQGDASPPARRVGLELQDLRFDGLSYLQYIGRIADAPVAELAHVDQRLDAADVDEGPELPKRRDRPADDRAHLEASPRLLRLRGCFVLEKLAAGDDDVSAAGIDLGHTEAQPLSDVLRRIAPAQVDLPGRAER